MKKWVIITSLLLISGFIIFNFREDEALLGDDYYYLSSFEAIDVGYPGGAIIYKSPEQNSMRDIKIRGDVVSVNHDDNYIIAIQQPKNSSDFKLIKSYNSNDTILNYFIISKKLDRLFGPYKKEEYLLKRKELGVPKELQL